MSSLQESYKGWEYARLGDYHRNLDPNWSYTPTYLQKAKQVDKFIQALPKTNQILDIACGEGVFVEKFAGLGWNIRGIDLNYESQYVQRGDVRQLPFENAAFSAVLFLDALEHLSFIDQPRALDEIHRVLEPKGKLLITIPNLAHMNSRVNLLLRGSLDRTDCAIDHLGERPMWENIQLLKAAGFEVVENIGITFTMPIIYRKFICRRAAQLLWLHDAMEVLSRWKPSLAMLNCFICKKI
jgi:SAM-dependent methyltransferase